MIMSIFIFFMPFLLVFFFPGSISLTLPQIVFASLVILLPPEGETDYFARSRTLSHEKVALRAWLFASSIVLPPNTVK